MDAIRHMLAPHTSVLRNGKLVGEYLPADLDHAALVAAIWPAESAVRGSLVEALEYE